jgi:ABC-type glutathione transport system ATPase component
MTHVSRDPDEAQAGDGAHLIRTDEAGGARSVERPMCADAASGTIGGCRSSPVSASACSPRHRPWPGTSSASSRTSPSPAGSDRLLTLAAGALTKDLGGIRAVDAVSFVIEPGRVVGLLGPNGPGKT